MVVNTKHVEQKQQIRLLGLRRYWEKNGSVRKKSYRKAKNEQIKSYVI